MVLEDQGKMESLEDRWVIDGELKLLSRSAEVLLLVTWQMSCLFFVLDLSWSDFFRDRVEPQECREVEEKMEYQ